LLRRHFFLAAALIVLIGSGVASATQTGKGPGGGGAPVTAVQAQARSFTDSLEVLGAAKGRQSVTLTAAATQLVSRVLFKDGQIVQRGAVLVELKNSEQDANLAQAQAKLVQAERTYQRFKTLGDRGFASKADIDQYEAAWRSAQADVTAARARRGDLQIRAPFAGVVGAAIVTLDDLSMVRVDFTVPERFIGALHEGQPISADADAYPGQPIAGRIAKLDTRVDEKTGAITARAEFANPGRKLKPGMMMRVSISQGSRDLLAVPESAVSVQGDEAFVYVISGQGQRLTAEQRPVETGVRQDGFVEIRDGLRAGDRIVADGLNKLQPGQPVRVAKADAKPPGPPS
jgi:membrane fusion protein (multidrug efflux system)